MVDNLAGTEGNVECSFRKLAQRRTAVDDLCGRCADLLLVCVYPKRVGSRFMRQQPHRLRRAPLAGGTLHSSVKRRLTPEKELLLCTQQPEPWISRPAPLSQLRRRPAGRYPAPAWRRAVQQHTPVHTAAGGSATGHSCGFGGAARGRTCSSRRTPCSRPAATTSALRRRPLPAFCCVDSRGSSSACLSPWTLRRTWRDCRQRSRTRCTVHRGPAARC